MRTYLNRSLDEVTSCYVSARHHAIIAPAGLKSGLHIFLTFESPYLALPNFLIPGFRVIPSARRINICAVTGDLADEF